ncbi:MAG: methyltransferase domain-containing protein [Tepidisphaeraceae bacterium]|jgi:phosphatidylethanolamine/phosphatidyl-N-methylethanolamine N-methyltransferase
MQEPTTRALYDVQSRVYDHTFGALVQRRISTAISHINIQAGDKVLDLGIGTGAALRYYPLDRGRIFGIDLSAGMLDLCIKRMDRLERTNATVVQGNALQLPFADNSFDHVFISHVISVVSDPCQVVREAQRVAKPQARIVMLNHFQSNNRLIAMVEKWLCPLCTKLGWRSDLALADLLRRTGAEVDYRFKLENIDLWETVVMSNNKSMLIGGGDTRGGYSRQTEAITGGMAA